jgi:hypothetical protein
MGAQNLSQRELLERVRSAREMQPVVRREVERRIEELRAERKCC